MLFLVHVKYSDPEREPGTEAANVISSIATEDSAVYTHIPLLGWVLSGSESQVFDLELEESCFFLFPTANRRQKNTIYLDLFRLFWMPSKKKKIRAFS